MKWLIYFLGSKITADGDCSHEIKIGLLLGRKVVTNLNSILKNRDITLSTKVHLVNPLPRSSQSTGSTLGKQCNPDHVMTLVGS